MWVRKVISLTKFSIKFLPLLIFAPASIWGGQGNLVQNGPVTTRFVVERNIQPDSKVIEIGWWMKRKKNWHTYWESPGDVGVPPTLKWELPKGISFKKISYAPPQLVKMFKVLNFYLGNIFWHKDFCPGSGSICCMSDSSGMVAC